MSHDGARQKAAAPSQAALGCLLFGTPLLWLAMLKRALLPALLSQPAKVAACEALELWQSLAALQGILFAWLLLAICRRPLPPCCFGKCGKEAVLLLSHGKFLWQSALAGAALATPLATPLASADRVRHNCSSWKLS